MTAASDALARVTDFTYNAANQPVQVTYPAIVTGQSRPFTLMGYDGEGRRVVETNEANVVTGFRYDNALGSLLSVTNAQGTADKITTSYSYDALGRQTNQVDAMGRRTAFEFDADGRRLRRLLPGAQSEGFAYDAVGNLLRQTNFNGQIITNLYDSQSRLLSRWHGSTQLVAHSYNLTGQRATMSNEAGVTTFVYDTRERLITNASPVGALIYAYDENGNLTNMVSSTAGGVSIGYQYDALNRLTNVIDNRLTGTKNTTYTFDAAGNLTALNYPNGVTNLWQYDARNRLTNVVWKLNATTHGSFAYQVGASGNRTNLSETVNGNSRNFAWAYDSLYRLTNETLSGTAPSGTISYKLDVVGNRTNRTSGITGVGTTNNYFDANDWLDIDSTTNNGSAWFDANGNTRTNGATTYLYDWANRLTNSSTVTSITYDADGNRLKKVAGGATILYLVSAINPSGYAQVVEELTVSGGVTNLSKVYTYGLDLISQRVPGSSTNFFGTDGLGSTRLLLNMAGSLANAFTYDAFGTLVASNGLPQTVYLFAGEQLDSELGLYYNRARLFDPNIGRFTTSDTFAGHQNDPLSLHKYLYAADNPVNLVDPTGHEYTYVGIGSSMTLMTLTVAHYAHVGSGTIYKAQILFGDGNSDFTDLAYGLEVSGLLTDAAGIAGGAVGLVRAGYSVARGILIKGGMKLATFLSKLKSGTVVISNGQGTEFGGMVITRMLQKGEKIADLINEAKALTFQTGKEHAIVSLPNGERALVSGGKSGIVIEKGQVKRIIGHTHPYDVPATGPSELDLEALDQLGQQSSYLLEHGQLVKFKAKN